MAVDKSLLKKGVPLSDHLPTALEQALHDLRLVERSKKWSVRMSTWYNSEKCECCLAGATIRSARTPPVMMANQKMQALDELRCGAIHGALCFWQGRRPHHLSSFFVSPSLPYGSPGWWPFMRKVLARLRDLEAEGVDMMYKKEAA